MKLTRILIVVTIVMMSALVPARSEDKCRRFAERQVFPPLILENNAICFVNEFVSHLDSGSNKNHQEITLYYVTDSKKSSEKNGQGLAHDRDAGTIIDAFPVKFKGSSREEIIVIHYVDILPWREEPKSSGKYIFVTVFYIDGDFLRRDRRASEWFNANYSWLSDGTKIIYRFPYQSREDVLRALQSPFASLLINNKPISVRVKEKAFLFESSMVGDQTEKYLIKGDRALLDQVNDSWCRIRYPKEKPSLRMWVMCDQLDVESASSP